MTNRTAGPAVSRRSTLARGLFAALAALAAVPAMAVTCSVSVPGLAFGAYDVFAAGALQSTTTVSVTCTRQSGDGTSITVNYTLALSTGASGSYAQRRMTSGANTLNYNVYTNSARTLIWGNGGGGSNLVAGSMTLVRTTHPTQTDQYTVYGSVTALQDVATGAYADSLTLTETF